MFPAKEINYIPKYRLLKWKKEVKQLAIRPDREALNLSYEMSNETSLIRTSNEGICLKDTVKGTGVCS